jgi:hypothetical protein
MIRSCSGVCLSTWPERAVAPGVLKSWVPVHPWTTIFYVVVHNIFGSSVWKLLHVTLLAPTIWRLLPCYWKVGRPLCGTTWVPNLTGLWHCINTWTDRPVAPSKYLTWQGVASHKYVTMKGLSRFLNLACCPINTESHTKYWMF